MNQIQTCWKFEGNFYYKSIGIKVLYLYVVIVDSLWFTEKIILKDKSNKNLLWSMLRRDPFWLVRKNQTSKEFGRHDDSIPYLDNAKLILFRTTQNGSRLSCYTQQFLGMNFEKIIKNPSWVSSEAPYCGNRNAEDDEYFPSEAINRFNRSSPSERLTFGLEKHNEV